MPAGKKSVVGSERYGRWQFIVVDGPQQYSEAIWMGNFCCVIRQPSSLGGDLVILLKCRAHVRI